jgi:hypothetical protein
MVFLTPRDLIAIRLTGRDVTLSEQMRTCRTDEHLDGFVAEAKARGRWEQDPQAATTLAEVRAEIARRAAWRSNR